jgi:hypothetical protein
MTRFLVVLLAALLIVAALFLLTDASTFALRGANATTGAMRGCYVHFDDWLAAKKPTWRGVQTVVGFVLLGGAIALGCRGLRRARTAVQLGR